MTRSLTRRAGLIVNTLTAVAIAGAAITASPSAAEAGGKDVAKGAALVALLAIGATLYQQQANARAAEPQVTRALPPAPLPQYQEPQYYQPPVRQPLPRETLVTSSPRPPANPGWQDARWQPTRTDSSSPRIPAICAVEIDGPAPATMYADTCLAREGFTYALPQYCAQTIRSQDWSGRVYDGACLRDAGFRTDRRW